MVATNASFIVTHTHHVRFRKGGGTERGNTNAIPMLFSGKQEERPSCTVLFPCYSQQSPPCAMVFLCYFHHAPKLGWATGWEKFVAHTGIIVHIFIPQNFGSILLSTN